MKKIVAIFLMLFASTIYSQITLIPDSEFEEVLILLGYDSDGIVNGQVLTSDIDQIISFGLLGNPLITDLTGLEDFASLEFLELNSVNITEINLSENLNLYRLDIWDVSLNSLDLSNNIALEQLHLSLNSSSGFFTSDIDTLDLSANTLLISSFIFGANLSFLDFSNNINLGGLELKHMDELTFVNLKNENNENLGWLQLVDNESLECVQVENPLAVIAGVDPPYDNWVIENNPIITDDCNLSINEYLASQITISPNPTHNKLTIYNNSAYSINTIKVYDVLGRLVLIENNPSRQLDVSSISTGLLYIKLETDQGVLTKKIIKE